MYSLATDSLHGKGLKKNYIGHLSQKRFWCISDSSSLRWWTWEFLSEDKRKKKCTLKAAQFSTFWSEHAAQNWKYGQERKVTIYNYYLNFCSPCIFSLTLCIRTRDTEHRRSRRIEITISCVLFIISSFWTIKLKLVVIQWKVPVFFLDCRLKMLCFFSAKNLKIHLAFR